MRRAISFWLAFGSCVAAQTACSKPAAPPDIRLAPVSPAPEQKPPAWIASISPVGTAKAGAQIRIRFAHDVVPLEALEAPERATALAHVRIEPALPGRFLFLTPRMIGFSADAPFPSATRVRVTLTAGFGDRSGDALRSDFAWTFATGSLDLTVPATDDAQPLVPAITVASNAELDVASLAAHATLRDPSGASVALVPKPRATAPATPPNDVATGPDDGAPAFTYDLQPEHALAKATTYRLELAAGIAPLHGNLPTTQTVAGTLRTFAPLALEKIGAAGLPNADGAAGRFAGGAPTLEFNNGLDAASAAKAISVVPAPAGGPLVAIADGDRTVTLNPYALAPATRYTVSVAPTLTDRFGQTLDAAQTRAFDSGPLAADVWAPAGFTIFPRTAGLALDVATTNLPAGATAAFRTISPERAIATDVQNADALAALLPPQGQWGSLAVEGASDRAVTTPVDVRAKLGAETGLLAYGVRARTNRYADDKGRIAWAEPSYAGAVMVTDIGLFVQWFPEGGIVRTHHLADGAPLAGAHVDVFASLLPEGGAAGVAIAPAQPCASGTTDQTGTLAFEGAAFAACAALAKSADEAPSLVAVARSGDDWTFVRTDGYGGTYQYGMSMGWSAGDPQSHGTIVTDRDLYQPGETAQVTGIAYFDTNGVLGLGRATAYAVTLTDPNGTKTTLAPAHRDRFGAFNFALPIAKGRPVGNYSLDAEADDGERLYGSFRVAEFKPPNFKVALTLDRQFATPGDTVTATWASTYLFGAPVEGGEAKLYVTRSQAYFVPNGWDAFSFGRTWIYPEETPSVPGEVLQTGVKVPADGRTAQTIAVAGDLPFPMAYEVDAQTSDASNQSVADSKTFTALPSNALIGLRTDFVARAGSPFDVQTIVTDPLGKALAGRHVRLVFSERQELSATQVVENTTARRDAVHYADIAQADVTSGDAPVHTTFTAPKAGTFRVRANFVDAGGPATASDAIVWASGTTAAAWSDSGDTTLAVKLDKSKYRPGDTATALVQSPYAEGDLFFAVVRHGVLYKTVQRVSGAAPEIRFAVTADMLPNAAVEAVLVRRGPSLAGGVPPGLSKLARIGFAPLAVALDSKYLKVALKPERSTIAPGATQRIHVRVVDAANRPVRGEVVLAVVNDAVLQLEGYRYPDLVQLVYADQPISTRVGDNRELVALVTPKEPVEKGFGFGGGMERGAAGTRVRTQFKPIAYFAGSLATDANGDAVAEFTVPDDLTTWRAMAMALGPDVRFGTSDATFVATKPLVTNAIVPQFARPGDRIAGGVAVTSIRRAGGDIAIEGTLSGALSFDTNGTRSATTTLRAPLQTATQAFRFPMLVTGTQPARVRFASALGGERDAFDVPLDIRTSDVTESVVTGGVTDASATIPLTVDPNAQRDVGGLEIELASSLLPEASEAVTRGLASDAPFASDVASRLAIASDGILLDRLYGRTARVAALQAAAQKELGALRALVRDDGGIAGWPGATRADVSTTAFATAALVRARAAGLDTRDDIARTGRFLRARLADPSGEGVKPADEPRYSAVRLEALAALASVGDVRSDFLGGIEAQRDRFDFGERTELARVLLRLPQWHAKGLALRDKLLEQVHVTGRNAAVNEPATYAQTRTAQQARLVALLLESHAPTDVLDGAFRSLLDLRSGGAWPCPCDDAEALGALVDYAKAQPAPPDFSAHAALPGGTLDAHFSGFTTTSVRRSFAPASLRSGTIALTKTGKGTLHYVVAYRYGITGARPGAYAGVRLDRFVRAANQPNVLAQYGLAAAQPLSLDTGRVFEIEDRITTDHSLDNAIVTDPLPAGLEAVDTTFATATKYFQARGDDWQIDYQTIYRDRVLAFAKHLDAGVYAVHYLVRSVTPGTFAWPAADVHPQFAPEDFGRTAAGTVTLK